MKLYKILQNNQSCSGGTFDWTPYLPKDGQPGEWTPKCETDICVTGYHGTDAAHLLDFADGNQLFEVEATDIEWHDEGDKFVSSSMRLVRQVEGWNEKSLRLFAVWCARQVEHLMTDERSKNAISVAERYANGQATDEELAAAGDAARDAAGDAARDAARAAARAAAGDAANAAARAATWAAAWAATWAAAWDAAWAAQYKNLYEMIGL